MLQRKIMPPTWLLLAMFFSLLLHFLFPILHLISAPWTLLGVLPIVLGVWINLAADKAMHQANTTVKPFDTSSTLITSGVFRISRNPMYLGFVLVMAGLALLAGSLSPWLMVLAFTAFLQTAYIHVEEAKMAVEFGHEWETYKKQTRRWV